MQVSNSTINQAPLEQPLNEFYFEHSSLASRALAVFVDYIVLMAVCLGMHSFLGFSDSIWVAAFFLGLIYFSIGNSFITSGQTIGKKAFGLRVVSTSSLEQVRYIHLKESFIRYLSSYGLLILLAELPPIVFRYFAVAAPVYQLEFPMLIAVSYFLANVGYLLFHPIQSSIHDSVSRSMVLRIEDVSRVPSDAEFRLQQGNTSFFSFQKPRYGVIIGILLASVLWALSLSYSDKESLILSKRFTLEHALDIRLLEVSETTSGLSFDIHIEDSQNDETDASIAQNFAKELIRLIPSLTESEKQLSFSVISEEKEPINIQIEIPSLKVNVKPTLSTWPKSF